jgi:hypothetical protein
MLLSFSGTVSLKWLSVQDALGNSSCICRVGSWAFPRRFISHWIMPEFPAAAWIKAAAPTFL